MAYKMVVFDLDGTLLDTLTDIALSVNTVLEDFGFKGHPAGAYRYFVGEGMDKMVQKALLPATVAQDDLEKMVGLVKVEYDRRWPEHTVPYQGIAGLLDFLEEKETPKAVFSNKPHQFAVVMVQTLLKKWHFADIVGIKAGTPKKPNPAAALKIVENYSLKPSQVVYLGDTFTDMQTAVNAGFYPAGALWGFREAEELKRGGAKFLASRPEDLKQLFLKE